MDDRAVMAMRKAWRAEILANFATRECELAQIVRDRSGGRLFVAKAAKAFGRGRGRECGLLPKRSARFATTL